MELCPGQNQLELANRIFEEGLKVKGFSEEEYLELRYSMALAYQKQGKLKEALNGFQECYAIDIRYRDVADKIKQLSEEIV